MFLNLFFFIHLPCFYAENNIEKKKKKKKKIKTKKLTKGYHILNTFRKKRLSKWYEVVVEVVVEFLIGIAVVLPDEELEEKTPSS